MTLPAFPPSPAPAAQPADPGRHDATLRQASSASSLELLERAAQAGAWSLELATGEMLVDRALAHLLDSEPDQTPPWRTPADFYADESWELLRGALQRCRTGEAFDLEARAVTRSGRLLWVRTLGEALPSPAGHDDPPITHIHGVLQDISRQKEAEQVSRSLTMRLGTTLASITDAFMTLDHDGRITYANPESERLLRHSGSELLGQPIWQSLSTHDEHHGARLRQGLLQALDSGENMEFDAWYAALGQWLELRAYPFADGLAVYLRDVTARQTAKDEIEHLAFHDALTQLPNRQLLMARLTQALTGDGDGNAGHRQPGAGDPLSAAPGDGREVAGPGTAGDAAGEAAETGALMFIDLDHFKVLNDTLGHARGDLLLQQVAQRLTAVVQEVAHGGTVARLGGDEFVVMLERLGADRTAAIDRSHAAGERILAALCEPYDLAGHPHHATCSIGITSFQPRQDSVGDLLKQADLAMYQAKALGRNGVCLFDPEMQAVATANAALNLALRQGLRERQFVLHYQPQVGRDGRMRGVEALLRWQHPQRGLVMPDEFIAQAEDSGLILPLGHWVLETACAQLARWAARPETAALTMSVNVSVRQFRHPEFVDTLMTVIGDHGIPARCLKLELTESLLATHIDVTIAKMGVLKEAGVTLAIDDFGMGYSALSYLKHMPLDQLKIDRSFVKDVLRDPNDAAIARTIIGLAQSLGLDVMAEGVETEAQREFLAWCGCESYQGYLFCKPLPIEALEAFMQARDVLPLPAPPRRR